MTKQELINECRRLQLENDKLQDELDRLSDSYTELEYQLADMTNSVDAIMDVNHFKYRLQIDEMLTAQLESFIEYYLKYHNV